MVVNLTPHPIVIYAEDRATILRTIEPDGPTPRVSEVREDLGQVDDIPVQTTRYGVIEGLPDAVPGTFLIVSSLLLNAAPTYRTDLIAPDTSAGAVRDGGRILGTVRFVTRPVEMAPLAPDFEEEEVSLD